MLLLSVSSVYGKGSNESHVHRKRDQPSVEQIGDVQHDDSP